jgi:cardiolipin synthase
MGPLKARDIHNLITLLRLALVFPVAWALARRHYQAALALFMLAGLSDGIDGYLAKRFGWSSRVGAILDPLADKVLLVSCYLVLGWLGALPHWLVFAVLGRDIAIVAGALAYHLLVGHYQLRPTWISKVNTVAQILLVVVTMFSLAGGALPDWLLDGLIYLVLLTTLWSGLDYIWTWSRRACSAREAGRAGRQRGG